MSVSRCSWAEEHELLRRYHDHEWGVPKHDDRRLFEDLVLDGAQAGLSWLTILRKREAYREAFAGFDPAAVAEFGPGRIEELLGDPGIVRNRQKVESAVANARAFLDVQEEFGSFDAYVWGWVDGTPVQNRWRTMEEIPARSGLSEALAADLKGRGFSFVGPVIVYAFMQAVGLVNDHVVDCHRHAAVRERK
ncbi:MAG TPA: DNA-3-methyladenine glycosylase I [Gemmatimonadota bacterium]|nr:DNA-3-methyladenine glycosylase I [Gemmatimonadota bacterium]